MRVLKTALAILLLSFGSVSFAYHHGHGGHYGGGGAAFGLGVVAGAIGASVVDRGYYYDEPRYQYHHAYYRDRNGNLFFYDAYGNRIYVED
jgi:hypothetical protein